MLKIYLKPEVSSNFRKVVNDYIDFSPNQKYSTKEKDGENAWNSLCSIMDRIDDLVYYLNQKELNNGQWRRCAFDFFEFIEQAGVLIDCVEEAFKIYNASFKQHHVIFKTKK